MMNRWLQNFAYQTSIGVGALFLSALLIMIIALVTVSYQSVKAATIDPVDCLKYE